MQIICVCLCVCVCLPVSVCVSLCVYVGQRLELPVPEASDWADDGFVIITNQHH